MQQSPISSYELSMLDDLPLEDRKKEIQQLIKLLNLTKSGQAKSVLISGDPGIGKTALLDVFGDLIRRGLYCRIVSVNESAYRSAESLYVGILDALRVEAEALLDEALVAVNDINDELGVVWNRQDLLRSIALVKLQESIGGKDAITQERLVKAIKSSVPTTKKLQFSAVNDKIEQLVNILVNPWLLVASNLINPLVPLVQEAYALASQLRQIEQATTQQHKVLPGSQSAGSSSTKQLSGSAQYMTVDMTSEQRSSLSGTSEGSSLVIDVLSENTAAPEGQDTAGSATTAETGLEKFSETENEEDLPSSAEQDDSTTAVSAAVEPQQWTENQRSLETLARHLTQVFDFVNSAIQRMDTGILIRFDHWDDILQQPEAQQDRIKGLMVQFLRNTIEQKSMHLMVALACRSQGESATLGGPLYGLFRNKMLLTGLSTPKRRRFFITPFRQQGIQVDEWVVDQVITLTHGNPFWLKLYRHALLERAEANQTKGVDQGFFTQLGVQQPADLLENALTRVQLALLGSESQMYKVIAALLKQFGSRPFEVQQAIRELAVSQGVRELTVVEVLRNLYLQGFLQSVVTAELTTDRTPEASDDHRNTQVANADPASPQYQIQERLIYDFLLQKTRLIETDISTDDKITYLQKIIPLSVKSGELDRQKTRDVIALSTSLGNDSMMSFLESTFLTYLEDDSPLVRLTALNNLAVLDSKTAFESILNKLTDADALVREYAFKNLSVLSQSMRASELTDALIDGALNGIDDESELVRYEVYQLLSRYKWSRDFTSVFLKGMSDVYEPIRIVALQNLIALELDAPLVRQTLIDAIDDDSLEVRKLACLGIQRIPAPETLQTLIQMLQYDPDPSIRAMSAKALSRMDGPDALACLLETLNAPTTTESVYLAIIRALALRPGWETESLMLDFLQLNAHFIETLPAVYWTAIRTLGAVGGTDRSLAFLNSHLKLTEAQGGKQGLLSTGVHSAIKRVEERMAQLQQLEKQLALATPSTEGRGQEELSTEVDEVDAY